MPARAGMVVLFISRALTISHPRDIGVPTSGWIIRYHHLPDFNRNQRIAYRISLTTG